MPGPLLTLSLNVQTRVQMRELGYGTSDIWGAMQHFSPDVIDRATKACGPAAVAALAEAPPEVSFAASGAHPFLDWLIAFLQSPTGKAIISMIITIILGFLAVPESA